MFEKKLHHHKNSIVEFTQCGLYLLLSTDIEYLVECFPQALLIANKGIYSKALNEVARKGIRWNEKKGDDSWSGTTAGPYP